MLLYAIIGGLALLGAALLMTFSPTDLAYCAGIIDGEGSIGIYRRLERRTYRITVAVAMCETEAVTLLCELFGGSIAVGCRTDRDKHRPQYAWHAAASMGALCLREILPYLRIKKAQAVNALRLQELNTEIRNSTTLQRKNRKGFGPARRGQFLIDPARMAECDSLYAAQKELNRRGVIPSRPQAAQGSEGGID
jgi:hypothetical protein